MADETNAGANGSANRARGNMPGHVATYSSMIGMLKWGAVACFVIAFAVIWLIS